MSNYYFTGFSTVGSKKTRKRVLHDLDLCIADLMNHFMTRPNERVMRPSWCCRVWDYVMEPLTDGIREIIADEVTNIVNADSRCELVSLNINEMDYGLSVDVTINFRPEAVVYTFSVAFDIRSAQLL